MFEECDILTLIAGRDPRLSGIDIKSRPLQSVRGLYRWHYGADQIQLIFKRMYGHLVLITAVRASTLNP